MRVIPSIIYVCIFARKTRLGFLSTSQQRILIFFRRQAVSF